MSFVLHPLFGNLKDIPLGIGQTNVGRTSLRIPDPKVSRSHFTIEISENGNARIHFTKGNVHIVRSQDEEESAPSDILNEGDVVSLLRGRYCFQLLKENLNSEPHMRPCCCSTNKRQRISSPSQCPLTQVPCSLDGQTLEELGIEVEGSDSPLDPHPVANAMRELLTVTGNSSPQAAGFPQVDGASTDTAHGPLTGGPQPPRTSSVRRKDLVAGPPMHTFTEQRPQPPWFGTLEEDNESQVCRHLRRRAILIFEFLLVPSWTRVH
eukprot:EG_transcript_23180